MCSFTAAEVGATGKGGGTPYAIALRRPLRIWIWWCPHPIRRTTWRVDHPLRPGPPPAEGWA